MVLAPARAEGEDGSMKRSPSRHVEHAEFTWVPVLGGVACLSAEYRDHAFAPHTHDTFVVGVFEAGAAVVRSEAKPVTVGANDVLVINPEAVHSAGPAVAEGWRYRAIYPTLALVDSILTETGHHGPRFFATTRLADPVLAGELRPLIAALALHRTPLALESVLVDLVHRLWGRASLEQLRQLHDARGGAGLERARELIDARSAEALSLETLAAEAGMSRWHFIRAFAGRFGLTPHAYVIERRVDYARRLLDFGGRPAEVAARCGCADQSHLIRHFKRVVGVTPGEYVRARRAPA